jgi:predicted nucleic acid-binding protein
MQVLVLDSCILLSFFNQKDSGYSVALAGMRQLIAMRTRLMIPSCVVLEVGKRLLYDVSPNAMRIAVDMMLETLEIVDTTTLTMAQAFELILQLDHRTMSLEDAIIIKLAQGLGAPVWTNNYRDFASMKNLEFWIPT